MGNECRSIVSVKGIHLKDTKCSCDITVHTWGPPSSPTHELVGTGFPGESLD